MRQHYGRAFVSVSPGYVGLSIVQSLSFGVPMIYARADRHCPEIDAAIEGLNSQAVAPNSPQGFAAVPIEFARDRADWSERRVRTADNCRRHYSAELMADRILEAAA